MSKTQCTAFTVCRNGMCKHALKLSFLTTNVAFGFQGTTRNRNFVLNYGSLKLSYDYFGMPNWMFVYNDKKCKYLLKLSTFGSYKEIIKLLTLESFGFFNLKCNKQFYNLFYHLFSRKWSLTLFPTLTIKQRQWVQQWFPTYLVKKFGCTFNWKKTTEINILLAMIF
jgi:hypothetical protein